MLSRLQGTTGLNVQSIWQMRPETWVFFFKLSVVECFALSILDNAKVTGPLGYITKPFSEKDLKVVIETAMFKHEMEVRLRESEEKFRQIAESIRGVFWIGSSDWKEVYYISPAYEELLRHRNSLVELVNERTAELRSNERKYRSIFETAATLITSVDESGVLIDCNRRVEEVLGYKSSEVVGEHMSKIIHPDYMEKASKSLEEIIKKGRLNNQELKMVRKDGRLIDVRINSSALIDDEGEFVRTISIIEDFTERRLAKLEAMRSSHLASIGELAAGVAHEINNPINGIINYAQMLANQGGDEATTKDLTGRIIREGDRIAHIVRSLLSFARLDRDGKHSVNISDSIHSVLALTEAQLKKDSIELKLKLTGDLPAIYAQPQQVEQVLLNIISNARHALNEKYPGDDKGKVMEIIVEEVELSSGFYVRTVIFDRGVGISEKLRGKVMNPFFTTKPADKGTGLGLSISHGIISDHEGKLYIDSVEGEYTSFVIDLPASRLV